jgi:hypothetical protein
MTVTAFLFIPLARWYPVQEHIQDGEGSAEA